MYNTLSQRIGRGLVALASCGYWVLLFHEVAKVLLVPESLAMEEVGINCCGSLHPIAISPVEGWKILSSA